MIDGPPSVPCVLRCFLQPQLDLVDRARAEHLEMLARYAQQLAARVVRAPVPPLEVMAIEKP